MKAQSDAVWDMGGKSRRYVQTNEIEGIITQVVVKVSDKSRMPKWIDCLISERSSR